MAIRRYTGFDGNATGALAGTKKFVARLHKLTGGALWNVGIFAIRAKRSKKRPSLHGTGRAGDISWRNMGPKGNGYGVPGGRKIAVRWMNILVANADLFGIELLIDYGHKPFGRSWRCDVGEWRNYTKPTVEMGGIGDWFHVELSPVAARKPALINKVFDTLGKAA